MDKRRSLKVTLVPVSVATLIIELLIGIASVGLQTDATTTTLSTSTVTLTVTQTVLPKSPQADTQERWIYVETIPLFCVQLK